MLHNYERQDSEERIRATIYMEDYQKYEFKKPRNYITEIIFQESHNHEVWRIAREREPYTPTVVVKANKSDEVKKTVEHIKALKNLGYVKLYTRVMNEMLIYFSTVGKTEVVQYLIEEGADILKQGSAIITQAFANKHIDIVELLLKAGMDAKKCEGAPLIWACIAGEYNFAKNLIIAGADINEDEGKPLIFACKNGHLDIVKLLIKAGANVHMEDDEPLRIAINYGHYEITKFLIEAGANVNANLIEDAVIHKYLGIEQLLLKSVASTKNLSSPDDVFNWACELGHVELVQRMIKDGVDINGQNNLPIKNAVESRNIKIVKLLIKNGVIVNDKCGDILGIACKNGDIYIVKALVEAGADVDIAGRPVCEACHNTKLFKYLTEERHASKEKALARACALGDIAKVKFLIEAGANVDDDAYNALENAIIGGNIIIIQMLILAGAKIDERHQKLLPNACKRKEGCEKIVKFLIEAGADVNMNQGEPIKVACEEHNDEVIKLLIKAGANCQGNNDVIIGYAKKAFDREIARLIMRQRLEE